MMHSIFTDFPKASMGKTVKFTLILSISYHIDLLYSNAGILRKMRGTTDYHSFYRIQLAQVSIYLGYPSILDCSN